MKPQVTEQAGRVVPVVIWLTLQSYYAAIDRRYRQSHIIHSLYIKQDEIYIYICICIYICIYIIIYQCIYIYYNYIDVY